MARVPDGLVLEERFIVQDDGRGAPVRTYPFPFFSVGTDSRGNPDVRISIEGVTQEFSQYDVVLNEGGNGGVATLRPAAPVQVGDTIRVWRDTNTERTTEFSVKGYASSAGVQRLAERHTSALQELADRQVQQERATLGIEDLEPYAIRDEDQGGRPIRDIDLTSAVKDYALLPSQRLIQSGDIDPSAIGGGTGGHVAPNSITIGETDFGAQAARASTLAVGVSPTDENEGVLSITAFDTTTSRVTTDAIVGGSRGLVDSWIQANPDVRSGVAAADALDRETSFQAVQSISVGTRNRWNLVGTAAFTQTQLGEERRELKATIAATSIPTTITNILLSDLDAQPRVTANGAIGTDGVQFASPDGRRYRMALNSARQVMFASDHVDTYQITLDNETHTVTGAVDDATATAAGIVELATMDEVRDGDTTGDDGPLVVTPAALQDSGLVAPPPINTDDTGDDNKPLIYRFDELGPDYATFQLPQPSAQNAGQDIGINAAGNNYETRAAGTGSASEIEPVNTLPTIAGADEGTLVNLNGVLYELIAGTVDRHILRGVAEARTGSFFGTDDFEWEGVSPDSIEFTPLQSAVSSTPSALYIRFHNVTSGEYGETILDRAAASDTSGANPRYAWHRRSTEAGLEAADAGDAFTVEFYTGAFPGTAGSTAFNVHPNTLRWERDDRNERPPGITVSRPPTLTDPTGVTGSQREVTELEFTGGATVSGTGSKRTIRTTSFGDTAFETAVTASINGRLATDVAAREGTNTTMLMTPSATREAINAHRIGEQFQLISTGSTITSRANTFTTGAALLKLQEQDGTNFKLKSTDRGEFHIEIDFTLVSPTTTGWGLIPSPTLDADRTRTESSITFASEVLGNAAFDGTTDSGRQAGEEIGRFTVYAVATPEGRFIFRLFRDDVAGDDDEVGISIEYRDLAGSLAIQWTAAIRVSWTPSDAVGTGTTPTVEVEEPRTIFEWEPTGTLPRLRGSDSPPVGHELAASPSGATGSSTFTIAADRSQDEWSLGLTFAIDSGGHTPSDRSPKGQELRIRAGDWRTLANAASVNIAQTAYAFGVRMVTETNAADTANRNLYITKGPNGRLMVNVDNEVNTTRLHYVRARLIPGGGVKGDKGDKGDPGADGAGASGTLSIPLSGAFTPAGGSTTATADRTISNTDWDGSGGITFTGGFTNTANSRTNPYVVALAAGALTENQGTSRIIYNDSTAYIRVMTTARLSMASPNGRRSYTGDDSVLLEPSSGGLLSIVSNVKVGFIPDADTSRDLLVYGREILVLGSGDRDSSGNITLTRSQAIRYGTIFLTWGGWSSGNQIRFPFSGTWSLVNWANNSDITWRGTQSGRRTAITRGGGTKSFINVTVDGDVDLMIPDIRLRTVTIPAIAGAVTTETVNFTRVGSFEASPFGGTVNPVVVTTPSVAGGGIVSARTNTGFTVNRLAQSYTLHYIAMRA